MDIRATLPPFISIVCTSRDQRDTQSERDMEVINISASLPPPSLSILCKARDERERERERE